MKIPLEHHPLKPFMPKNARLLMLGSFPPPKKRWCMKFFYPSRTKMGMFNEFSINGRQMRLWRMPSSSRAYPMPLKEKAAYYHHMMEIVFG